MATKTNTKQPTQEPSLKREFLLFLSIPVGMILLVTALLVVPSMLAKPGYDFIYVYCPDYGCQTTYTVAGNGTITQTTRSAQVYGEITAARLYRYDHTKNASTPIDLATARSLNLDASNVSPDGYTLSQDTSGGGFLFWGDSGDGSWYLKQGIKKKHVTLTSTSYYNTDVTLLGWIR